MKEMKKPLYKFLFLIASCTLMLSSCSKKKSKQSITLSRGKYDAVKMANGASLSSSIDHSEGSNNALLTATSPDSYQLKISLHVVTPKPATTLTDLSAATPEITKALPELKKMIPQDGASPFFKTLYDNKIKMLDQQLPRLGQLFPRETLYDCQTILPITNGDTHQQALLIQAIMNVNTDGSDGDRNIPLEKLSTYYQPQTNYRWKKNSDHPNPNLAEIEKQRLRWKKNLQDTQLTPDQKSNLEQKLANADASVTELKRWSFLIGSADPFIVLPRFMIDKKSDTAQIGDYAIVLYNNKLYPAIVGDIGPSSKIGEASLRLCRAIDPASGAAHRPVEQPLITYFVFPGSADQTSSAPDYNHWSQRCQELWKKLGGSDKMTWHSWKKLDQPWPTPEPVEENPTPESTNTTASNSTTPNSEVVKDLEE